jgi:hypothetical protein
MEMEQSNFKSCGTVPKTEQRHFRVQENKNDFEFHSFIYYFYPQGRKKNIE